MEIQKINSIQTISLNGKKYWRAFVPSEDCFKTFAELSSSSRVFACSEDFLLITDDENKVFLFEKKDDSVKQVHLNEPFMKSVFGEENTDFFILIELPETNLLICQEKIFLCKSYNVDKDIFKAKIIEDGKEKDLEAWYGYELGVKKDYQKAKELFSKACDLNNVNACFDLGLLYYKEKPQNLTLSKQLFKKACDLGDKESCHNYEQFIKNNL